MPPFVQTKTTIPIRAESGQPYIHLDTVISIPASGNGPPRSAILLLHFWGGCNRTFARLTSSLAEDHAVIAPSLRGWGTSSKPVDPGAYRITDFVDDIVRLLQHLQTSRPELLGRGIVIAGHSMGGKIAQVLFTRHKIAHMVRGFILIAPAPAGAFQLPEEMRDMQVKAYESHESARMAVEHVLLGSPTVVEEDEIVALVEDAVSGSKGAKQAWPAYSMGEDFEEGVLAGIRKWPHGKIRVLVVIGALDRVEPEPSVREKVVKKLEDAGAAVDVVRLEEVGHLIPVEAPEQLAESMRSFIAKITQGK